MDKYEISLWEDYPETAENGVNYLDERKLAVIGSDTMMSQIRAIEPKMVTNINGTHTFTFKMYYWYTDEMTGEKRINPFGSLLINERKVKVKWNDEWYDMLIKSIDEDTSTRSMIYTCQDLYITELSKNGYELEFTAELQNNSGTAAELAESVLEGTSWHFDAANSTHILQETEEPVYEVSVKQSFSALWQKPSWDNGGNELVDIPSGATILIFYSDVLGLTTSPQIKDIQFAYSTDTFDEGGTKYLTEENGMLVLNANCYKLVGAELTLNGGVIKIKVNNNTICQFSDTSDPENDETLDKGISTNYRANRLVEVQKTAYDELFDRYVNVYENDIYGYVRTEYSDPTLVINLIANPNDFKNTDGWVGDDLAWGAYPKFTTTSEIANYTCKSYLHVGAGKPLYNCGIDANQSFLKPSQGDIKDGITGGFHKGEAYILRIKAKADFDDPSTSNQISTSFFTPKITTFTVNNGEYTPNNKNYFTVDNDGIPVFDGPNDDKWLEYRMVCNESISSEDLENYGIFFINIQYAFWIEEVQFFKEAFGVTTYDEGAQTKRMNPGEVSLQGISKQVYRYYPKDHGDATKPEEVKFLYEGTEPSSEYIPVTNDYEKITTIEAKNSNRFNILQSIAENFECWVRFTIEHEPTGKVMIDKNNGYIQKKYVTLVEYVGTDLGWSFEYGIDLKTIKRKIISDDIVTKVIVIPNENEFAQNGFCTIARSDLNYSKENFILNFDYYINQGLLDRRTFDRDLYSSGSNWIGYYYKLHNWNREYDALTGMLIQKNMEYTKQSSKLSLVTDQLNAEIKKRESCESDIMLLANVTTWAAAESYVREHYDNKKVQSLMNARAQLINQISKDDKLKKDLEDSVGELKRYIENTTARQSEIADDKKNLHAQFFKKYSRYLQEGTWQDGDYIDDDKYYLDAVDVAYTSSRPQIQYTIDVMRLCSLEDYSSKKFNVGDICYVQDREYFGYGADGITPYKLKIIISEITSYFDQPEKDQIKVQNYKTQFDDLFQRITATTQSLQYSQGGYEKAASVINHDKTLSFDLLQDTFDYNENWVLNSSGQHVTWDDTGLTVTDDRNAGLQVKLMAGGLFITNDGGASWKNAIRGDGISADVLTAGRINTSEIFVYDGNHPKFRWDSDGISAYTTNTIREEGQEDYDVEFGKYIRFDQFGIYGYAGPEDFRPASEKQIWYEYVNGVATENLNPDVRFGLTWKGFFLHGASDVNTLQIKSEEDSDGENQIRFIMTSAAEAGTMACSLEISTDKDIVLKTRSKAVAGTGDIVTYEDVDRIQIGRFYTDNEITDYGIWVRDADGNNVFNVSANGVDSIGGWNLTKDSFYHYVDSSDSEASQYGTIGFFAKGKNWTILGPESTDEDSDLQPDEVADTEKVGNAQAETGRPSNGHTADYYIIAGNRFGVTIDGEIYAAGGRIGGWSITRDLLESSHIVDSTTLPRQQTISIRSDGRIICNVTNSTWDPTNPDAGDNSGNYQLITLNNQNLINLNSFTSTLLYNSNNVETNDENIRSNFDNPLPIQPKRLYILKIKGPGSGSTNYRVRVIGLDENDHLVEQLVVTNSYGITSWNDYNYFSFIPTSTMKKIIISVPRNVIVSKAIDEANEVANPSPNVDPFIGLYTIENISSYLPNSEKEIFLYGTDLSRISTFYTINPEDSTKIILDSTNHYKIRNGVYLFRNSYLDTLEQRNTYQFKIIEQGTTEEILAGRLFIQAKPNNLGYELLSGTNYTPDTSENPPSSANKIQFKLPDNYGLSMIYVSDDPTTGYLINGSPTGETTAGLTYDYDHLFVSNNIATFIFYDNGPVISYGRHSIYFFDRNAGSGSYLLGTVLIRDPSKQYQDVVLDWDDNSYSINSNDESEEADTGSRMWEINENGEAYFHNIEADGGTIAGWHIDKDHIWTDSGTSLSAGGNSYDIQQYTIVTNSISASGGSVGGWSIGQGLKGGNIELDPRGIFHIGGGTIASFGGSIININTGINVGTDGVLTNGRISTTQHVYCKYVSPYQTGVGTDNQLTGTDVRGLHEWAGKNGYYKPQDVGR